MVTTVYVVQLSGFLLHLTHRLPNRSGSSYIIIQGHFKYVPGITHRPVVT